MKETSKDNTREKDRVILQEIVISHHELVQYCSTVLRLSVVKYLTHKGNSVL